MLIVDLVLRSHRAGARRAACLAVVWLFLSGLPGCSSGCDEETINRAVAFLDANQSCDDDGDCVVVSDHCRELPGGFCGQLAMNRQGNESAAWQAIERELRDCAPERCSVCAAALVPTCVSGSCRGTE
jgi:hypothetical protein